MEASPDSTSTEAAPKTPSAAAPEKQAPPSGSESLSYKGSVSGLRGLISNKIAEGIASVVSTLDRVSDMATGKKEGGTEAIPIEKIYPCPDQPRQIFEPKSLEELSMTMKELGQAQAITVRKTASGYEIISGERRYRAAKLAGLTQLDCVVKDCSPSEGRLLALVENIQRQDLLPIEEAFFLKRVLEENSELSLEKLARLLGSHKSTLSEKIQLTEVPQDLQPMLYAKGRHFTHRHWRVISRIRDEAALRSMVLQALEHQLSVAELERALAALGVKKASRRRTLPIEGSHSAFGPNSLEKFNPIKKEGQTYRLRAMTLDPIKVVGTARQKLIEELEQLLADLRKPEETANEGESAIYSAASAESLEQGPDLSAVPDGSAKPTEDSPS